LFWPLAAGARVFIASHAEAPQDTGPPSEPDAARDPLRKDPITHLQCTPTIMRLMLEDDDWRRVLHHLRVLLLGGEPVPQGLVELARAELDCRIYNVYGPTETTVWSALRQITGTDDAPLIGRPVANTTVHVLDEHGRQVPVGVPGELYIGGAG